MTLARFRRGHTRRTTGGLDATAVYVLLPRAEYDAFAGPWSLPAVAK